MLIVSILIVLMLPVLMVSDQDVNIILVTLPQHIQCIGSTPLSPLSYTTVRSHVFNGKQPSNERCTNGISIDGEVTIDCGQGTTLIDCDQVYNDNVDYSDLSNYFIWNKTALVDQKVSMVFRFYQQIRINRISMFFWNLSTNSIIVPNVRMYWSNDDSITPSKVISVTTNSPSRISDVQYRLNADISSTRLELQYLRIVMIFYGGNELIFLSEVQFCGE